MGKIDLNNNLYRFKYLKAWEKMLNSLFGNSIIIFCAIPPQFSPIIICKNVVIIKSLVVLHSITILSLVS